MWRAVYYFFYNILKFINQSLWDIHFMYPNLMINYKNHPLLLALGG